ncbi:LppU/SCO3897 family protein [Nocardia amikacinitolerans]|uniref:LppU/SCO3897 family protein n=1 Tax=Nocardia amikacinitolerans TaxID=756689 RepID=UPI0020A41CAA|nr:hypothetical protein [Nocardia amikacinitolerans]MCP2275588.1 hypothetical protein [Nocardia amikacinitolerans]
MPSLVSADDKAKARTSSPAALVPKILPRDCIAVDESRGPVQTRLLDCDQPAATYRVIERHESDDGVCPVEGSARITLDSGVTHGSTICLSRK